MIIKKLIMHNFGVYASTNVMDFSGNKPVVLIGGMNGRGKTTLLDSVFICLYGRKSIEYIIGKRTAYNKLLQDRINKSAIDNRTYVKLVIEMDDEESTIISITRF